MTGGARAYERYEALARHVDGQISAEELYRRTVSRYRRP